MSEDTIRYNLLKNLTTQNALDIVVETLEDKISSVEMQMSVLEKHESYREYFRQQALVLEWKAILADVMNRSVEKSTEELALRKSLKELLEEQRIH
tara:strand:- start:422 stop:709 length:288 start_codon:yes stop_codon:yes gene_type:complete